MNFDFLVQQIESTHVILNQAAVKTVNIHLTLRNWLIGCYIFEFEQNGEDRSIYGSKLIPILSSSLREKGLSNINERELRRYRLFYKTYSTLGSAFAQAPIRGAVPPELTKGIKRGTMPPETKDKNINVDPDKLLNSLSFTHIAELIEIDDPIKRGFYELECIKGQWSVRELQRQINTLYFERSGISGNPAQMSIPVFNSQNTLLLSRLHLT